MSARLARRGWHRPCQGMGRWAESLEITHTEMQIHLQLDRGWLEPKHRRTHPAASRSPHRSPPVPATRGLGKNKVSRCFRISRATASLSLSARDGPASSAATGLSTHQLAFCPHQAITQPSRQGHPDLLAKNSRSRSWSVPRHHLALLPSFWREAVLRGFNTEPPTADPLLSSGSPCSASLASLFDLLT